MSTNFSSILWSFKSDEIYFLCDGGKKCFDFKFSLKSCPAKSWGSPSLSPSLLTSPTTPTSPLSTLLSIVVKFTLFSTPGGNSQAICRTKTAAKAKNTKFFILLNVWRPNVLNKIFVPNRLDAISPKISLSLVDFERRPEKDNCCSSSVAGHPPALGNAACVDVFTSQAAA